MPYNTRRKSVSLTQLGIHIPNSSRSSSQRSPPAMPASSAPTPPAEDSQPPSKRVKKSHPSSPSLPSPVTPARSVPALMKHDAKDELPSPRTAVRIAENTPPPDGSRVDTEGINDEIVVAVIEQLEKTGNRPHLLKELAAILQHSIAIVQSSANQPAIISSRLATYMKRHWTVLAPCPLGKELIGTHPKRIYFYLTTQPRQAFPDPPGRADAVARIITPSLTSAENEEEDKLARSRAALSPSPEVDLSTPELEHLDSPVSSTGYFHPAQHALPQATAGNSPTSSVPMHRFASPPLEGDEREFTQTASSLQQRRVSDFTARTQAEPVIQMHVHAPDDLHVIDESEERRAHHDRTDSAALFGHGLGHLSAAKASVSFMESSPLLKPQADLELLTSAHAKPEAESHTQMQMQDGRTTDDFQSFICESVDMQELDDLFAPY